MINQIRTDTLESKIAHYRALGNYDAANAIEALARQICAPIREHLIEKETEQRKKYYFEE